MNKKEKTAPKIAALELKIHSCLVTFDLIPLRAGRPLREGLFQEGKTFTEDQVSPANLQIYKIGKEVIVLGKISNPLERQRSK